MQQLFTVVFGFSAVLAYGAQLRMHPSKALDQKLSAIALNKHLNKQILSTLKAKAECNTHAGKISQPSVQCVRLCKNEPDPDCVGACDEVRVLICDPPGPGTTHIAVSDSQSAAVAAAAASAAQDAVREAVKEAQAEAAAQAKVAAQEAAAQLKAAAEQGQAAKNEAVKLAASSAAEQAVKNAAMEAAKSAHDIASTAAAAATAAAKASAGGGGGGAAAAPAPGPGPAPAPAGL